MKEIKAREGYYLTQSQEEVQDRIYVTIIKGQNVREDDWREAAREEKEEYERRMEEDNVV
jgi:hypothetical protein